MVEMTSRERWPAVLNRQEPDRVPMDYWGTPEITHKVMAHLGVSDIAGMDRILHIDRPVDIAPVYAGPPIADDADMWGCRYRMVDIGTVYNDLGSQLDLMCSPATVRKLFVPGIRQLAKIAHKHEAFVFLHSDGAIRKAIPDLIEAGVDILNPIQWRCRGMEREGLKRDFGEQLILHGGVDNQQTLVTGSVEDVRAEVRTNIEVLGKNGGYILAPCHALQAVSPPENVVAMYEAGYEYG